MVLGCDWVDAFVLAQYNYEILPFCCVAVIHLLCCYIVCPLIILLLMAISVAFNFCLLRLWFLWCHAWAHLCCRICAWVELLDVGYAYVQLQQILLMVCKVTFQSILESAMCKTSHCSTCLLTLDIISLFNLAFPICIQQLWF